MSSPNKSTIENKKPMVIPSAPLAANPMLAEVQLWEHLYGKKVSMNDRFESKHIWSKELAIHNNGRWIPQEVS
jgi:hypothetical protein